MTSLPSLSLFKRPEAIYVSGNDCSDQGLVFLAEDRFFQMPLASFSINEIAAKALEELPKTKDGIVLPPTFKMRTPPPQFKEWGFKSWAKFEADARLISISQREGRGFISDYKPYKTGGFVCTGERPLSLTVDALAEELRKL
jgi:hypothetical protein